MKYYVYTLAHNGTVFYVGKGSGNRIPQHEKEALRGHTCCTCEVMSSIWRNGSTVPLAMVSPGDPRSGLIPATVGSVPGPIRAAACCR